MPRFTVSRSGISVQPGTRPAPSAPKRDVWTKDNWRDRIQERTAPPRVEKPRFTVTGSGIRVQTAVEREIQEKAKREFDDRTWNTRIDARQRRFDVDQKAQDVAFRRQLDVETVGRALERQGAKLPHLQRAGSEALRGIRLDQSNAAEQRRVTQADLNSRDTSLRAMPEAPELRGGVIGTVGRIATQIPFVGDDLERLGVAQQDNQAIRDYVQTAEETKRYNDLQDRVWLANPDGSVTYVKDITFNERPTTMRRLADTVGRTADRMPNILTGYAGMIPLTDGQKADIRNRQDRERWTDAVQYSNLAGNSQVLQSYDIHNPLLPKADEYHNHRKYARRLVDNGARPQQAKAAADNMVRTGMLQYSTEPTSDRTFAQELKLRADSRTGMQYSSTAALLGLEIVGTAGISPGLRAIRAAHSGSKLFQAAGKLGNTRLGAGLINHPYGRNTRIIGETVKQGVGEGLIASTANAMYPDFGTGRYDIGNPHGEMEVTAGRYQGQNPRNLSRETGFIIGGTTAGELLLEGATRGAVRKDRAAGGRRVQQRAGLSGGIGIPDPKTSRTRSRRAGIDRPQQEGLHHRPLRTDIRAGSDQDRAGGNAGPDTEGLCRPG